MNAVRIITLFLFVLLCAGCKEKPRHRAKESLIDTTGGVLLFEDNFNREFIGENYRNYSGRWVIKDGWLHNAGDNNVGLWLNRQLPQNVRVEFDARSESEEGDIKFEIFASAQSHSTGYILIMGGWKNSVSIIARKDEHGADRIESDATVEKGKTYHFTVVRKDKTLHWLIDGKPFLRFDDPQPLTGGFFAFNNWRSKLYFDNLKIYSY